MLKIPNQERSQSYFAFARNSDNRTQISSDNRSKENANPKSRPRRSILPAGAPAGVCFLADRRRQWIRDTEIAQALIARFAKRRNYSRGNPAVARTGGCESGERRERQQSRIERQAPAASGAS